MENIKYLDTALTTFSEHDKECINEDGSIQIPITLILDALKKYEIGIPEDYFKRDGVYFGIRNWLVNEEQKGNIAIVCENNTCNLAGNVSVDFGFAQYDSLTNNDTFVLMHIHNGEAFLRETMWHNRFPAILFKFEKGTSFYDVLDDITFENPNIPSMTIEINNQHYLVLPRITNESYFVKCVETGEELESTDKIYFSGNEENVREQIKSYLKMRKTLIP